VLRKFKCVEGCSDCCNYREYYPSVEYGKIGVLILPEEKFRIEEEAKNNNIRINIIPRLGSGRKKKGIGPKKILAYQMMGKKKNGDLCPFLEESNSQTSSHIGLKCKIYENRPLACRAYPIFDDSKGSDIRLDGKWQFCKSCSTTAHKESLGNEIEAFTKIKTTFCREATAEIWRYATAVGEDETRPRFFSEGWVLECT